MNYGLRDGQEVFSADEVSSIEQFSPEQRLRELYKVYEGKLDAPKKLFGWRRAEREKIAAGVAFYGELERHKQLGIEI